MPQETPVYDLTLLISTAIEEEARAQILAEVENAIQRGNGSIVSRSDWGTRNLAYQIQRQNDAEFHLLQMTGPPSLLEELGHSLHITDGVLRFRIIKSVPGARGGPASARGGAEGARGGAEGAARSGAEGGRAESAPPGASEPRPETPAAAAP